MLYIETHNNMLQESINVFYRYFRVNVHNFTTTTTNLQETAFSKLHKINAQNSN